MNKPRPEHDPAPVTADQREPVLDGVRGLAFLIVLFHHVVIFSGIDRSAWPDRLVYQLGDSAWFGVDLFFVLSGAALQKLGRLDDAARSYREVIRLRPASPQGYANLGNALLEMGRPDEALPAFEHALRLDPSLANMRVNAATALASMGRREEALSRFRDILTTEPGSADVHLSIGILLEDAGRLDEAVAHYEASVRLEPQNAGTRVRLGNALYRRGDLQRAAEYAESLEVDPASAEAHNNLGACLVAIAVMVIAAVAGALFGSNYDIMQRLDLPNVGVSTDQLGWGALIAGVVLLVVMLVGALLGAATGQRYHTKIDRAAYED